MKSATNLFPNHKKQSCVELGFQWRSVKDAKTEPSGMMF